MNSRKTILLVLVLLLIAGTAGMLAWFKTHQRLGAPGIRAEARPGTVVVDIQLPETVLDYTSVEVPQPAVVTNFLPKDTSLASRRYTAPDEFWLDLNVVLMGADRTSIHKPEYCLPGQGWQITRREVVPVRVGGAEPYEMSIARWTLTREFQHPDGRRERWSGLYVFWFVAENQQTISHGERIRWLVRDLLQTGVLQRWAYVSYFAVCPPGLEDNAFERVKEFVSESIPRFQHPLRQETAAARSGENSEIVRN